MKLFISLPLELLKNNLTDFWKQLYPRVRQDYPDAKITSNYTGDGSIKDSDVVLFIYEFKDEESCKKDIQKCKELGKSYQFFKKFYSPNRFYFPR